MYGFYEFGDLRVGMRVNVEGVYGDGGDLRAHVISIKDDGEHDEIAATIDSADAPSRTVRMLGLALSVADGVLIQSADKRTLGFDALAPGMRVKTKGRLLDGRRFRPEKIKVKPHTPDEMDELEGTITAVDPGARSVTVLGFRVRCDEDCAIES
jgi:hypothetical protein